MAAHDGADDVLPPLSDPTLRPVLFQAIVASAMDAIVALDSDQRIVLFNPAAEAMFRCPASEALGQPLARFLPQPSRDAHRKYVAAFGQTGDTSRSMGHLRPLTGIRADGDEFRIEATIAKVAITGHAYFAAIVRDISGRQRTEAGLQRQAHLLDLAHDAIFTWQWNGPITFWSQGAEQLYGYSSSEAVGRVSQELLRTHHEHGIENLLIRLERTKVWEGELIHTRRDGSEVLVESRLVLLDEAGGLSVLEATRDITARKQAEIERASSVEREATSRAATAAALASRDALQEILDGLPGGVYLVAASDGQIEFANAAMLDLLHRPRGDGTSGPIYGRDFRFLRADGTPLDSDERPGSRALRGERIANLQLLLRRDDGTEVPVAVHTSPLRDGSGNQTSAIVFMQDVTPLRQAEQLKDDFLALVSHELRTPLTAIHGGARVLINRPGLDVTTRAELLHDVVTESERLERLLTNLLSLTNITAGRLRASLEPVMMEPLVQRVVNDFRAQSAAHTFTVEIAPQLPPAEADPHLFEEVLRNLYENAIKYSPQGGSIVTTLVANGTSVVTRITDEGVGIAPDHVGSVFERFRRVGGDSTVRGMGLGLYLCRGLVEAQSGVIEASSPGVGRGATFIVTLPIARGWTESAHRDLANVVHARSRPTRRPTVRVRRRA